MKGFTHFPHAHATHCVPADVYMTDRETAGLGRLVLHGRTGLFAGCNVAKGERGTDNVHRQREREGEKEGEMTALVNPRRTISEGGGGEQKVRNGG